MDLVFILLASLLGYLVQASQTFSTREQAYRYCIGVVYTAIAMVLFISFVGLPAIAWMLGIYYIAVFGAILNVTIPRHADLD